MRHFLRTIGFLVFLGVSTVSASALSILVGTSTSPTVNVDSRLTGLGHDLTVSNPSSWTSSFDYSFFDLVVFDYDTANPAHIGHLVDSVVAGDVGVVFFRGNSSVATAQSLGVLSTTGTMNYQSPTNLNVTNNSHAITAGMNLGVQNLGFDYMALYTGLSSSMTTLATGPNGVALAVHDTLRIALAPFYGHSSNYNSETQASIDLTERTLQWAAGTAAVPLPAGLPLLAGGLGMLGFLGWRRKKAL